MEREIDFNRDRHMRCRRCHHQWTVDVAWLDRWRHGGEACPGCGVTCEAENGPRVIVAEGDPALDNRVAVQLAWYHTSTFADWPPSIDFAAALDDNVRTMMGGAEAVARWAHRQSTKALHIGTYESAIHNMLRRIRDQGDEGRQFYLYRVTLRPEARIQPGWTTDPSNFVGDFHFEESGFDAAEVVRYANEHEDAGGLSLAIRPSAIGAAQRLAIPLAPSDDDPWIAGAVSRLSTAPPDPWRPRGGRWHGDKPDRSPRAETAAAISKALVDQMPVGLRYEFATATSWRLDSEPVAWARWTRALAALIEDTTRVLTELDAQELHLR